MKCNFFNLGLIILFFIALVIGCSEAKNAKPAAETAIGDFHQLFNEGRISDIYKSCAPDFRSATTETEFNELMSAVSRKLGKEISTTNQNWNVKNFNLSTSIVMVQNTEFEQGYGTETFTFEINGDKAILLGYYINSNDLITK